MNKYNLLILIGFFGFSAVSCAESPKPSFVVNLTAQCLLGGAEGKEWRKAADIVKLNNFPSSYHVFDTTAALGDTPAEAPALMEYPCEDEYNVAFAKSFGQGTVAVGGADWKLLPRQAKLLDTNSSTYQKVVKDILVKEGFANPVVSIKQIIKVDLEGDGVDEVIITASQFAKKSSTKSLEGLPGVASAGDYSFVALRKIVDGEVSTYIVTNDFHVNKGEYKDGQMDSPYEFLVTGVLDLNGDGIMEIVVNGAVHEGEFASVYKYALGGIKKLLFCGCGA